MSQGPFLGTVSDKNLRLSRVFACRAERRTARALASLKSNHPMRFFEILFFVLLVLWALSPYGFAA